MNSADVMHATSQKEVCDFRDYGLNNKILLLPNGISNKWVEMKGSAERFREKYKIDKKYRLLLFMSRITPKKGLERLIRIWSKITYRDNWKLVIIGSDEAGYLKIIEKMIDDLNLHNSIIHIDSLYSQEKRDAFAASELFILPSLSEGSPMVILDSLGAGVPVITTDVTPWEILNKLNIGWWVENSENGLEKALREALCIDKLELANKGRLSCEYVQNNCLWDTIAKQSISIYKNLYL
jgi:glycosyltransferase involved in cell wall biosynthesis